ncbi:hypothetical protein L21SP5_03278 [Salinivirga cyanobacteriivorans]|uniref:Uncharacterized protein n=1 Tax=Salinivirga cyanobacteriivorans TaxID=1307839 RepID=A0A0S2I4H7_9BACT|nr:bZIP transcription factor [Salinivirga cyanobacteriivorans]ALO16892.1 hypothetical protein L21SP5_03278 [Salinivirga cyanobacteriivorans]
MKNLMAIILAVITLSTYAQPNTFNYQGVMRDQDGTLMTNTSAMLELSVLDMTEMPVYTETHDITTNDFGQFSIHVGAGVPVSGDFNSINWGSGEYMLSTSVSLDGGANYTVLGVSPILAVPYALHAANSAMPEGVQGQILTFNGNNWVSTGALTLMENKLAIGAEPGIPKLLIQGDASYGETDPIFEVRNSQGMPIFSVYEDGVEIHIDESSKSAKGGFAVGGLTGGKDKTVTNYFKVAPDSVRIYVKEEEDIGKAQKGGFAVGGLTGGKNIPYNLFTVSPDSTRIYVQEQTGKAQKGGFAVGGLTGGKRGAYDLFRLTPDSTRFYVPNSGPDFPNRSGFAVEELSTGKEGQGVQYLNLSSQGIQMTHTSPYEFLALGGFNVISGQPPELPDTTGIRVLPGSSIIEPYLNKKQTLNEQRAIIEKQKARIDELEKQVKAIKEMLDKQQD